MYRGLVNFGSLKIKYFLYLFLLIEQFGFEFYLLFFTNASKVSIAILGSTIEKLARDSKNENLKRHVKIGMRS
jgi:hypothetical protein